MEVRENGLLTTLWASVRFTLVILEPFMKCVWSWPLKSAICKAIVDCLEYIQSFAELSPLFSGLRHFPSGPTKGSLSSLFACRSAFSLSSFPRYPRNQSIITILCAPKSRFIYHFWAFTCVFGHDSDLLFIIDLTWPDLTHAVIVTTLGQKTIAKLPKHVL